MAHERLSVSEARKRFSELLKRLREDPETIFEITVNGIPVGELRPVEARHCRPIPPGTFRRAVAKAGEPELSPPATGSVARDHDDYLYRR